VAVQEWVRKKTSNFDACRDLSGRRLRHVNNEKRLAEWYKEEKERELAKLGEKFAAKKRATHIFDELAYNKEMEQVNEGVSKAVKVGLLESLKEKEREMKNQTEEGIKKRKASSMVQHDINSKMFESWNMEEDEKSNKDDEKRGIKRKRQDKDVDTMKGIEQNIQSNENETTSKKIDKGKEKVDDNNNNNNDGFNVNSVRINNIHEKKKPKVQLPPLPTWITKG